MTLQLDFGGYVMDIYGFPKNVFCKYSNILAYRSGECPDLGHVYAMQKEYWPYKYLGSINECNTNSSKWNS